MESEIVEKGKHELVIQGFMCKRNKFGMNQLRFFRLFDTGDLEYYEQVSKQAIPNMKFREDDDAQFAGLGAKRGMIKLGPMTEVNMN